MSEKTEFYVELNNRFGTVIVPDDDSDPMNETTEVLQYSVTYTAERTYKSGQ